MNDLTERVIGACIEVHRNTGPGLLESAYQQCVCRELNLREIPFQLQVPIPVKYKGTQLDRGFRADLLVDSRPVLEIKAVETVLPVHKAQLLTYLRMGGWTVGLLINFNVTVLTNGITRVVHDFPE